MRRTITTETCDRCGRAYSWNNDHTRGFGATKQEKETALDLSKKIQILSIRATSTHYDSGEEVGKRQWQGLAALCYDCTIGAMNTLVNLEEDCKRFKRKKEDENQ